jgi:electron-transferring-flavoprotein dehydrogenase
LGDQAQALGIEIFPGFAAQNPIIENGVVRGVVMNDFGLGKDGEPTAQFAPGPEIRATVTLLAEGCRGHITKTLVQHFNLQGSSPQTYALGFRELWRITPEHHRLGEVTHTIGAPLPDNIYGGGFVYHLPDNLISIGFVVGLDYHDPQFHPHHAFQAFKQHPDIAKMLEGGERISAAARALYEGGLQGMHTPAMPGAILLGDAAGTLNVPKIKGIHTAMASGIIAAEVVHKHLATKCTLQDYIPAFINHPVWHELYKVRNIRPGFNHGLWFGLLNAALETLTRGLLPWTLQNDADHTAFGSGDQTIQVDLHHPTFTDRLMAVHLGGQAHREDQPNHLQILQPDLCATRCAEEYGNPCTKFCPAGVYEILNLEAGTPRLHINSSNCIHCKTCDIKDPYQIINWTALEGGSGPNHSK